MKEKMRIIAFSLASVMALSSVVFASAEVHDYTNESEFIPIEFVESEVLSSGQGVIPADEHKEYIPLETFAAVSAANQNITIPDYYLNKVLRNAAGVSDDADLTAALLAGITRLSAPSSQISCLDGIQYCTGLKSLDLSGNNITDLTPLSALAETQASSSSSSRKLTSLNLADNRIADIQAIAGFTKLTDLDLSRNRLGISTNVILDLSPLSSLTSLVTLNLSRNKLENLYDLDACTKLEALYVSNSQLTELSGLENHTNLKILDISDNNLTDLAGLDGCTNLKEIYGSYNSSLMDLSGLEYSKKLEIIEFNHCSIADISAISAATGLKRLYFNHNSISDLSPVGNITAPNIMCFADNQLDSDGISIFIATDEEYGGIIMQGRTTIRILDLSGNGIENVESLKPLTGLRYLDIHNNAINTPFVVEEATEWVSETYVDENGKTQIDKWQEDVEVERPVFRSNNLRFLSIYGNNITEYEDFSYLSECMTSLKTIEIDTFVSTEYDVSAITGSKSKISDIYVNGSSLPSDAQTALAAANISVHHGELNTVPLSDEALAKAVSKQLYRSCDDYGLTIGGTFPISRDLISLTVQDAKNVEYIDAGCNPDLDEIVSSFEGLENFTSLKSLTAVSSTADLTPAENLSNLSSGTIIINSETGDSNVNNLIEKGLKVYSTFDYANLQGNTGLEEAVIQLLDLDSSASITLQNIEQLTFLDAEGFSALDSLDGISALTALKGLNVKDTSVYDVLPLLDMSPDSLTYLKLDNTMVKDLTGITNLADLEYLSADNCEIETLTVATADENTGEIIRYNFDNLKNLKYIYLNNNLFSDISELSKLTAAKYVFIAATYVTDISLFMDLNKLQILDVRSTDLDYYDYPDITALENKGVDVRHDEYSEPTTSEPGSETTTSEINTETTTDRHIEPPTDPIPENPYPMPGDDDFIYGDVNVDQQLDVSDASATLAYALDMMYATGIRFNLYALNIKGAPIEDIKNLSVTSEFASAILGKVLDNVGYQFDVEKNKI